MNNRRNRIKKTRWRKWIFLEPQREIERKGEENGVHYEKESERHTAKTVG
jgi:hypothetical protein